MRNFDPIISFIRTKQLIERMRSLVTCLQSNFGFNIGSHLPEKCILFIYFNVSVLSPLKMMKNAFYIILKTLFVLEIFNFLL